jgi:hypothetical protein
MRPHPAPMMRHAGVFEHGQTRLRVKSAVPHRSVRKIALDSCYFVPIWAMAPAWALSDVLSCVRAVGDVNRGK